MNQKKPVKIWSYLFGYEKCYLKKILIKPNGSLKLRYQKIPRLGLCEYLLQSFNKIGLLKIPAFRIYITNCDFKNPGVIEYEIIFWIYIILYWNSKGPSRVSILETPKTLNITPNINKFCDYMILTDKDKIAKIFKIVVD